MSAKLPGKKRVSCPILVGISVAKNKKSNKVGFGTIDDGK